GGGAGRGGGAPPVPVKENDAGQFVLGVENRDGAGRFTAEVPLPPGDDSRRSVYVQVRRSRPLAVLDTFDWATTEPNCEARNSSTATPQALMLMNGEFVISQSEAFADRVRTEAGGELADQVARAWALAFRCLPAGRGGGRSRHPPPGPGRAVPANAARGPAPIRGGGQRKSQGEGQGELTRSDTAAGVPGISRILPGASEQ